MTDFNARPAQGYREKSEVQRFIEDTIGGGWRDWSQLNQDDVHIDANGIVWGGHQFPIEAILLDPKAWQAVGKTRGWKTGFYQRGSEDCVFEMSPWHVRWHRVIDALASGKTFEQSLAALN